MEDLALTPVDIRHKEFSTALAGYKKEEVREFLNLISNQLEDIQLGNAKMFSDMEVTEKVSEEPVIKDEPVNIQPEPIQAPPVQTQPQAVATEDLIGRTLVLAEEMKIKIINEAKQQAAAIINEAEQKVENLLREASDYQKSMESELGDLQERKKDFLMNFRSELIEWLEKIEQDPVFDKDREMKIEKEKLNRNLIDEVRNLKNELSEPALQETDKSGMTSNIEFDDDSENETPEIVKEELPEEHVEQTSEHEEDDEDISLEAIFGISDNTPNKNFEDNLSEELSNAINENITDTDTLIKKHSEPEKAVPQYEEKEQNENNSEEDLEDDLQFEEHEPLFKD